MANAEVARSAVAGRSAWCSHALGEARVFAPAACGNVSRRRDSSPIRCVLDAREQQAPEQASSSRFPESGSHQLPASPVSGRAVPVGGAPRGHRVCSGRRRDHGQSPGVATKQQRARSGDVGIAVAARSADQRTRRCADSPCDCENLAYTAYATLADLQARKGARSAIGRRLWIPSETGGAGTVDLTVRRGGFEAVTAVRHEGTSIASDGVTAIGRYVRSGGATHRRLEGLLRMAS